MDTELKIIGQVKPKKMKLKIREIPYKRRHCSSNFLNESLELLPKQFAMIYKKFSLLV